MKNIPVAFANSSTEMGSSLGGFNWTGTLGSNLPAILNCLANSVNLSGLAKSPMMDGTQLHALGHGNSPPRAAEYHDARAKSGLASIA